MSPEDYTLYCGAASGAEACFGEMAERWSVSEVNYTFQGHDDSRTRGLKVLTETELLTGDVSLGYVGMLMGRTYRDTPMFRNVLRCIWHQVNSGQQVFCVGWIKADNTVKGGTGWGAEFAKLCNKPLYVFDQREAGWFQWQNSAFELCEQPPVITEAQFTGTGTRLLEESGRQAITDLFQRTWPQ